MADGPLFSSLCQLLTRNFSLLFWPPMFGALVGLACVFCFTSITKQRFIFSIHGLQETQTLCSLLKVAACHSFTFAAVHVTGKTVSLQFAGISSSSTVCQEVSSPHFSIAFSSAFHSDLEARCLSFMYQGLAASTRRTYSCAQQKFINFCIMIGHVSSSSSPCPATEWTLCLFATFLPDSLRHSSIKEYLSAVQYLHVYQGFPDPLENCLRLQRVVRGIKHSQGSLPANPRLPLSSNILRMIHSALDLNSFDDHMFWAACLLAYFGFLRSAEFNVPSLSAFDPSRHLSVRDIAVDVKFY